MMMMRRSLGVPPLAFRLDQMTISVPDNSRGSGASANTWRRGSCSSGAITSPGRRTGWRSLGALLSESGDASGSDCVQPGGCHNCCGTGCGVVGVAIDTIATVMAGAGGGLGSRDWGWALSGPTPYMHGDWSC